MSDNHKHDYHRWYHSPDQHAYSVVIPPLPGAGGPGAMAELTVYVSVVGAAVQEIGREYEGSWAYAVTWDGELYLHGDAMKSRPLTHERIARDVAEVAAHVAVNGRGADEETLSDRLYYFADGELPPEGFSWSKDSALWQVVNGDRKSPRFTSAVEYLGEHFADNPVCTVCGDTMDCCARCA